MNNSMHKFSLVVITILVATAFAFPKKQPFLECRSSDDCGMDECCVLSMMRYSVPSCRSLGSEGDTCRPLGFDKEDGNSPQNVTVTYPDGSSADLYVHKVVCPCVSGLECSEGMVCAGLDGAGKLVLREDIIDAEDINDL